MLRRTLLPLLPLFPFLGLTLPAPVLCAATDAPEAHAQAIPDDTELFRLLRADRLEGDFVEERTVEGFPKPLVSKGVFRLNGKRIRWETHTPFRTTVTVSPEGIVFEGAGSEKRLSSAETPAVGRVAELLTGLLSGDPEPLRRRFRLTVEKRPDGTLRIRALPKRELSELFSEVTVEGRTHVEHVRLVSPTGETTRMTLTNVRRP